MLICHLKAPSGECQQGRSQGPDFGGGGASSFKGCRATSPPRKFNILYRVSEIQKNKGSPFWKFGQEEFTRLSS